MDKATILSMLQEAQQAYHELMTGKQTVSVTDQSGDRIQYNVANAGSLLGYIESLQTMLANNATSFDSRPATRPLFFRF